MSKFKYLFKNIGLLAVSQFGTKLLAFFLVPLYTNVLSTSEYGTYDLFSSTINLLIPLITLNVADAVLRFSIDDNSDKKSILSIGVKYSVIGTIIAFAVVLVNHVFSNFNLIDEYWFFFPLLFFVTIINSTFTYFCRGIDKVKNTAISGVICSVVMIGLNIYFLLGIKIGLLGFFWANIIALLTQIIYLFFSCKLWNYLSFDTDKLLEKEMKNYSAPLIANNIAWWINNSSDRYIVTFFCGVAQNGIYSVGYKIPTILNMFQSIFSQAWTLSAVKDFDKKDSTKFFSKMYNLYNCGMVIVCSGLILLTRVLAKILYAKEFYVAWKYVPFLLTAIVFGSLSGYLGGIFSAVKDSKIFAQSTVIGAVVNTVLNVILVFWFGPLGAAVATMVAFWLVWAIRLKHVEKYMKLSINIKRDYFSYFLLIIQSSLFLIINTDTIPFYLIQSVLVVLIIVGFKDNIKDVIKIVTKKGQKLIYERSR